MVCRDGGRGTASRCRLRGCRYSVWGWWCGGLDWLAGDEDGEDQAGQGDDEHRGEGDGEGLALGEFDGEQGRADQGGAE